LHPDADFRAGEVSVSGGPEGAGELRFTLHAPGGTAAVRLAMAGAHNVANALAAAAASVAAGATLEAVAAGLATVRNVPGRLRLVAGRRGVRLYDDTYNANPGSVRAAISFLATLPAERWLVLGDMAELGPDSAAMHAEMGEAARKAGVHRLFAAGPQCRAAVEAFGANAEWYAEVPALAQAVQAALRPGVTVLVKGSRSMGMERVVEALAAAGGAPG
jgi:UDP-N-acetylmuramoyl-tripeptide--D-alanyl-D-alanine ligase